MMTWQVGPQHTLDFYYYFGVAGHSTVHWSASVTLLAVTLSLCRSNVW
jgi:hypothetical protein